MEMSVSFMLWQLYPRKKSPWVGSVVSLDVMVNGKILAPIGN